MFALTTELIKIERQIINPEPRLEPQTCPKTLAFAKEQQSVHESQTVALLSVNREGSSSKLCILSSV